MRTVAVILGLLLLSNPSRAAIEPPDDPRQVAVAISILNDRGASEKTKLEALSFFTKTTNLTDSAFWTLLQVAGAPAEKDEVRVTALVRLSGAISYILPEDVERAENIVALMSTDKFQKGMAAVGQAGLPELRAKRLYFFGAATLNIPPALSARLGPVFLPMLLSSLRKEKDPTAMNEGLWSLSRLLEIKAVSMDEIAPDLRRIASSDADASIRDIAKKMLSAGGALIN
jgi:hypothetical protein